MAGGPCQLETDGLLGLLSAVRADDRLPDFTQNLFLAVGTGAGRRSSREDMIMPVELRIGYQGGATETVRLPVEMGNLGSPFVYRVPGDRTVVSVELDPRQLMQDVRRENDVWRR